MTHNLFMVSNLFSFFLSTMRTNLSYSLSLSLSLLLGRSLRFLPRTPSLASLVRSLAGVPHVFEMKSSKPITAVQPLQLSDGSEVVVLGNSIGTISIFNTTSTQAMSTIKFASGNLPVNNIQCHGVDRFITLGHNGTIVSFRIHVKSLSLEVLNSTRTAPIVQCSSIIHKPSNHPTSINLFIYPSIYLLFYLFYFILFYFILFYFILFYFILFYFILFYFILFYFILFYFILFYFILFYFILFYFILFYFILFYFILFYFILFYLFIHSSNFLFI